MAAVCLQLQRKTSPRETNLTKHRRASCSPELHTLRDDLLTHFLLPGENLPNGLQWPPYSFRWHAYNYDYTYSVQKSTDSS